ncbi:MAG: phage baseplate assembly protein V [Solirubrobacterales bacterium]
MSIGNLFELGGGSGSSDHKIYGVSIGIVTNIKDPEKLGRIKVKLPYRETEHETDWIRIVTLMGGAQMGTWFLPEVGSEVLLAFAEGDVNMPFVIGTLWNSKEKPPETNEDGKNNIRKIKTRSGHELIFNDESGKENITLKTAKGQQMLLDDKDTKIVIKDKSGNNVVTIDGQNNAVEVSANMKITIKAGSCKLLMDGSQNKVQVESPMNLTLKGQMVKIEAGATLDVKCDGMVNIKGAMVKIN